jgi:hypothetical protein
MKRITYHFKQVFDQNSKSTCSTVQLDHTQWDLVAL